MAQQKLTKVAPIRSVLSTKTTRSVVWQGKKAKGETIRGLDAKVKLNRLGAHIDDRGELHSEGEAGKGQRLTDPSIAQQYLTRAGGDKNSASWPPKLHSDWIHLWIALLDRWSARAEA